LANAADDNKISAVQDRTSDINVLPEDRGSDSTLPVIRNNVLAMLSIVNRAASVEQGGLQDIVNYINMEGDAKITY